ncbi:MAG: hypothetical protein K2P94_18945 [Rhodospirillaceae bacterium]|nr:hypothetical protein [Rhodospirillaceae bacterium]
MDKLLGTRGARVMVALGRVSVFLALIALVSAWVTEFTGGTFVGLSQQHLFNDAIALSLVGVAFFLDAYWHAKSI